MFVRQYAAKYPLVDNLVLVLMFSDTVAACGEAKGWDCVSVGISFGVDLIMAGHSVLSGLGTLSIDSSMVIR